MPSIARSTRAVASLAVICITAAAFDQLALGQAPAPLPLPLPPPSPTAPGDGGGREAQLEERVRQLEAMVRKLSNQVNGMAAPGGNTAPVVTASGVADLVDDTAPDDTASPDTGTAAEMAAPSSSGGPAAPGQSLPPNPPPSNRFDSPAVLERKKANVIFGPGFEIRSDDDEFILQFHNLTQVDYRGYEQGGQHPTKNTFAVPRQWFMFSGRITKPFGYFVSLANGFDTTAILDVFIDVDYDPRARIRAGRMKTPFTYEFLIEPIQGLIQPERSLFFNNFGQNRDDGVMLFGRLFQSKLDYAVGIYNGTRNGNLAQNNNKHISAFANFKPFNDWTDSPLENFNIGGSVFAGGGDNTPNPNTFRTNVPTSGNPIVGIPFLAFNSNIRENGFRALWDLHFAWYYKQLALLGEWGSGFQTYAPVANLRDRTYLPVNSWYIQAGYLLTGETRSGLGVVKPNNPFSLKSGEFGLGAWELALRYDYLTVGQEVFKDGLANPKLWSNNLYMTDVGMNWHLNQYVKVYFDWEHAVFGSPVQFAPNRYQKTSDLFMVRLQLYF